ncbi:MAG: hypothetical protein LBN23_05935 [Paludibacter sp.]|jgi:hypothetical protein|nr:hypothetical protein [Paludibacter sp.]
MEKKVIFTVISMMLSLNIFGQITEKQDINKFPIPKNLEECFVILDKTMSDNENFLIKTLQEDSISYNENFEYGADFFLTWKLTEGSKLTKYFNKKGLFGFFEIYETILISYHRYLNGQDINLNEQITKYQLIKKKEKEEYLKRQQQDTDTINGIYIPKDIEECFAELDKILTDSAKSVIKHLENGKKTIQYQQHLGMWMQNNWGLFSGSRLQKYFFKKKIKHPDIMSLLILEFYYDYLNNSQKNFKKWSNNLSPNHFKY